jgi:hypothetical protein
MAPKKEKKRNLYLNVLYTRGLEATPEALKSLKEARRKT